MIYDSGEIFKELSGPPDRFSNNEFYHDGSRLFSKGFKKPDLDDASPAEIILEALQNSRIDIGSHERPFFDVYDRETAASEITEALSQVEDPETLEENDEPAITKLGVILDAYSRSAADHHDYLYRDQTKAAVTRARVYGGYMLEMIADSKAQSSESTHNIPETTQTNESAA